MHTKTHKHQKYRLLTKGAWRANQVFVCQTCHQLMTWRLPPIRLKISNSKVAKRSFFYLYFATYYQYPISQALNKFKDDENLAALMVIFHALYQLPKPVGCHAHNTVIVPVPTTNQRLAKRGFYPVMILAKCLAYHWGLPIWQGLVRIDDGMHQRGLDRQARLDNVQDAFAMTNLPPVKQLILFDDVVTTGATLQAVAETIMRDAPDARLLAVCVAHGTSDVFLGKG